jgi:hypothetical protein
LCDCCRASCKNGHDGKREQQRPDRHGA